jgi:hypothetical protein
MIQQFSAENRNAGVMEGAAPAPAQVQIRLNRPVTEVVSGVLISESEVDRAVDDMIADLERTREYAKQLLRDNAAQIRAARLEPRL